MFGYSFVWHWYLRVRLMMHLLTIHCCNARYMAKRSLNLATYLSIGRLGLAPQVAFCSMTQDVGPRTLVLCTTRSTISPLHALWFLIGMVMARAGASFKRYTLCLYVRNLSQCSKQCQSGAFALRRSGPVVHPGLFRALITLYPTS